MTADLRPWRAGDEIHVEDDLALKLIGTKEAKNMRPFRPQGYQTKVMSPEEGQGSQNYRVKAVASGFRDFSAKLSGKMPSSKKKAKA
ncbi:hypothetical protein [Agrobacterium vitis]|uniref:hypothetical protein n=1 Tax=Agrobacterium vitis TaxID=373 RepID=UPI00115FA79C|nr:hypothetical protein [Agrobacterium vitis]NSX96151.1 hypothetical protein [Agrobacterium vitis]NSZ27290.1 hypothetical protein [Agrobacterium vitis]UJL77280.1 hypothetical protein AVCG678_07065 [Agrobacterium vitis]UJL82490.1 hypothetical protein AVCG78_07065 [Agrobacterium vitis]